MDQTRVRIVVAAVFLSLLVAGCVTKVEQQASPPAADGSAFVDANEVDLAGTWKSDDRVVLRDGERDDSTTETLVIEEAQDGLFKATRTVTLSTPVDFETGEGEVVSATLASHGVINPDGSFTIVKKGEIGGEVNGWLLSEDEMEIVYTESGDEPIVMRETLRRV